MSVSRISQPSVATVRDHDAATKRRRTGCFTCRKRKKKCDETRPRCKACARTGYLCEGFPTLVRFTGRNSDRSPNHGKATMANFDQNSLGSNPDGSLPIPDAGVEYDFAKQLDDLSADELNALERMRCEVDDFDLSMGILEPADFLTSTTRVRDKEFQSASNIPRGLPFLIDGIESPIRRRLFMHFTKSTSSLLTTSSVEHNPFLNNIIPRSLQDSMIREAILCMAASHLSKLLETPEQDVDTEKEKCLGAAETEQFARLALLDESSNPYDHSDREAMLIAALLLCLYEVSEGTGDACWRIRWDTARYLVNIGAQNTSKNAADRFLLEFFVYHDVLASVTDPSRQPFLDPGHALLSSSALSRQPERSHMIGVYNGLLKMVAKVAALQKTINDAGNINGMHICEAMDLWSELEQWQPCDQNLDDQKQERLVCSAYISALFVWLYTQVYPTKITDIKVQQVVKEGLCHLGQINTMSSMSVLLFPVFVLGFACVQPETRQDIQFHFQRLIAFSGFGNVRLARDVVRRWWSDYDSGRCKSCSWTQQMDLYDTSLPLT